MAFARPGVARRSRVSLKAPENFQLEAEMIREGMKYHWRTRSRVRLKWRRIAPGAYVDRRKTGLRSTKRWSYRVHALTKACRNSLTPDEPDKRHRSCKAESVHKCFEADNILLVRASPGPDSLHDEPGSDRREHEIHYP